jgi:hypothetical protein
LKTTFCKLSNLQTMDIVKFKITSKTIKVEVRNSNNYVFNFNTALDIAKEDKDVLLKLYNALDILFKKENANETKNYVSPNQTNILDQISDVDNLEQEK